MRGRRGLKWVWAALLLGGSPLASGSSLGGVEAAVRVHTAERLGVEPGDVEIRYLGMERELDCPEGADFLVESSPSERFRGHADLRIRGHHHGVPCEQIRIRPMIQVWIEAVVAAERAQVGEAVRLMEQRVLLSSVSGDNVALDSGPWLSTTTLDVGEVVTRSKVRARPDVRGGQSVVIVAGTAPLSIRSDGRLLSDAKLGDEVRVANLGTGTVVKGVLIEPDLVRAGGTR